MCERESSRPKNKITRDLLKSTAKRHRDDIKLYTVTRIIIEKCKLRFTRALLRQRIFLPQNNHFVIVV